MSKREEEMFEQWWKEFETTDAIVNFCNDQLKYVAEKAWYGYRDKLMKVLDEI